MQKNTCRLCKKTKLETVLDLGFHPHSDHFLTPDELNAPETHYPLRVDVCASCGFWQLDHVVDPKTLYQINYLYDASVTKGGWNHFHELAASVCKRFDIKPESLAVDIGSNVGVLLDGFRQNGLRVIGVDPAPNIALHATAKGFPTIVDFFTASLAASLKKTTGPASVITATNVFAHIDDLDDLAKAIGNLLTPKGLFIVEVPHVLTLVKNTEYDTIYHQHLSYMGIKPLIPFFRRHGLELFDVEQRDIHGGTIRLFVSRKGAYPVASAIKQTIAAEEKAKVYDPAFIKKTFSKNVEQQRTELTNLLRGLKSKGKRIVGVSAPAKGNTLLNYCHLTSDLLDYITEKTEAKIGRYTPGTHIKIETDDKLLRDMPDYALILAWNFANEIMSNLQEYKSRGGKFIIPIPHPRVV